MLKRVFLAVPCLLLAACSAAVPASPTASGSARAAVAADSGAVLPAVTDQELDDLIGTVMQGIDVPR